MPFYDYFCANCGATEENMYTKLDDESFVCSRCRHTMTRKFPTKVHTKVDTTIDSKDVGKIISEKNAQLKVRESGYKHEEQNLREKITKQVQEKTKDK
jgi:putative FmdB family regulatory protein